MIENTNVKYKVDFKSKKKYFYNFFKYLFSIIILLSTVFYLLFKPSFEIFIKVFLSVFLFSSIFYLIPLILLFRNYLKYNEHLELVLGNNDKYILNLKNKLTDSKISLLESNIKSINLNLSHTLYDKRMRLLYWDELFYYEIILKTNEKIFISCLLCDELIEYFPNVKNNRIKRIFPNIKINNNCG